MDRGLLLLALEPDPGERLPRLFNPGMLSVLGYSKRERSTSRGHLMALASNYLDCCDNAGLSSPLAERFIREQTRSQGNESFFISSLVILELAHIVRQDLTSSAQSQPGSNASRGSTSDLLP
jgi:hypothetical protein